MSAEIIVAILSAMTTILTVYINNNKTLALITEKINTLEKQLAEYKCNVALCEKRFQEIEKRIF